MRRRQSRRGDELTGLPQREVFLAELDEYVRRADSHSEPFVLFFVEVQGLAELNTSLGVGAGDDMLRSLADRMVRAVDKGFAARFQGATFALLLPGVSSLSVADPMALAAAQTVSDPVPIKGRDVSVGAICGGCLSDPGVDSTRLVERALRALGEARRIGVGAAVVYDQAAAARQEGVVDLERLRAAYESGTFRLQYQPVVQSSSGATVGAEALLRLHDAATFHAGAAPPARDVVDELERSPLAVEVGMWVHRSALGQLASWAREGVGAGLFVAVNVGRQLLAREDYPSELLGLLEEHGLPGRALVLDVRGPDLRAAGRAAAMRLVTLQDAGVRIVLENFGVGDCSLEMLHDFRFDGLRLSRKLMSGVAVTEEDTAIAEAMVHLARRLRMSVIGTGVESREQLVSLSEAGCPMVQGYLFGSPVSPDEFRETHLTRRIPTLSQLQPT